ncbi:Heat shock protein 16 [Psilocybe cubensis]|uniref:Small heat shock protein n=2 Tax=Psilocybe cubensis TaxID=181762 RepID=A0A8H8CE10_PSICU|nr:Heat shock protein 16 [Psilocybe cubensis]KAH9481860.1 Heat shock protein 16 [Psilocybe cubensis]
MSIFYYEPFYDFEQFLDNALTTRSKPEGAIQLRSKEGDNSITTLRPRMDLHEDSKQNIVTATFELPGLKKEDVDIQVNNNRLTISGESKISTEKEENGYVARERRFGKFSRTLQLPHGVEDKQIKAGLDNGVLTVTFPKSVAPKAQESKKITIN